MSVAALMDRLSSPTSIPPRRTEASPTSFSAELVRDRERLDEIWQLNRDDLREALELTGATHQESDVIAAILAGRMQLWAGKEHGSALITEFVLYPRLVGLRFFMAGGHLKELLAMEQEICERAKAAGIGRLELGGRAGWERALPGYRRLCSYLVKEI